MDATNPSVSISDGDRDIAIRTMLGEEGSPDGMAGVAATILNRAQSGQYGGRDLTSVALAPGQFEPWSARASDLMAIRRDDPQYIRAGEILDGVASGKIPDLTNGATHFYAPGAQQALGRNAPAWAQGQGTGLGKTMFYAPKGAVHYVPPAAKAIQDATAGNNGGAVTVASAAPKVTGEVTEAPVAAYDPAKDPLLSRYLKPAPAYSSAGGASAPPAGAPAAAYDAASDPIIGKYLKAVPAAPKAAPAPPETPIGVNDTIRATATGVPILGGLLNKADAGTNALLAPVLNRFFSPENQLQGDTLGERYNNALAQQNKMDEGFAAAHPIANTVANVAGAVGGTIHAMMAAPSAFGVGGGGLLANSVAAGASGSAINAADSATRNGLTPSNVASGAVTGFAGGAAGPIVGKIIGAGVGGISNLLSGAGAEATRAAKWLHGIGMSPPEVGSELQRLGPSGTIADVDPALTLKAQALAASGGKPTSILKNAFTDRAAGADDRVGQAIDTALGAKPDLTATQDAIYAKAQAAASPFYKAAEANPSSLDANHIIGEINSRLDAGAVGGTRSNLLKVKKFLTDSTVTVPGLDGKPIPIVFAKSDPQQLLSVRQELDGLIEKAPQNADSTASKTALRALKDMRGMIDDVVKTDPNIKAGDAAFSQQMRVKDALQQGTELFTKGTRLEDFKRALSSATPEQVEAMRQGARSAIGDAFESARQGQLSAARSMFGKATANRAKLDALFPNAGDVFDKIASEQTMRGTENVVRAGSKTAETHEAVKEFGVPTPAASSSLLPAMAGYAMGGEPGAAAAIGAKSAFGALKNAFTEASRNRLNAGLAKGLSATGPDQAAFLSKVGRAYGTAPLVGAATKAGGVAGNLLARTTAQRNQKLFPNVDGSPLINMLSAPRT